MAESRSSNKSVPVKRVTLVTETMKQGLPGSIATSPKRRSLDARAAFNIGSITKYEHLTAEGRWFRGVVTSEMAASGRAALAKQILEGLD